MSTIHVCPLSRLEEHLRLSGAGHVVTLLAGPELDALAGLPRHRRLRLDISDISEARSGHVLPAEGHMARLIDFVTAWDRAAPLLIHCYAGVSRSTAAAFIALCALSPGADEQGLAARLRFASPTATPNPRMIALADRLLGRAGRMVKAIQAIGRGAECFEGVSFALPLDHQGDGPPLMGTLRPAPTPPRPR
jgi:predicted protein tyrosine phosphatase